MSKWKKMLYNPVYVKETKLRVRNIKFALTILFYNLILIGIAVFGFEVLFNSGMNDYVNYGTAIGYMLHWSCSNLLWWDFLYHLLRLEALQESVKSRH